MAAQFSDNTTTNNSKVFFNGQIRIASLISNRVKFNQCVNTSRRKSTQMRGGAKKLIVAIAMIALALLLDLTSSYSPIQLVQLLISFALAIGGALVAIRGLVEFLSERF